MGDIIRFVVATLVCVLLAATVQATIPASFDARTKWPSCIPPVMNQGVCGSGYAFAGAELVSAQKCISTNGATNIQLSPQHIVSCGKNSVWTGENGCKGGWPDLVHSFVKNSGCTGCTARCTSGCEKYVSGNGQIPSCRKKGSCPSSNSPIELYKWGYDQAGYFVSNTPITVIQEYVMTYGPISAVFFVTYDFYDFFKSNPTGVFKTNCPSDWRSSSIVGTHAVILIGWGTASDGTPYWLLQNSWGTGWGDNGVFRMKRGTNICSIENYLSTVNTEASNEYMSRNMDELSVTSYMTSTPNRALAPPGQPSILQTNSMQIMEAINWAKENLNLDNQVISRISPTGATSQVVNGINYEATFDAEAGENKFLISVLINRSPDGSLMILNQKVDIIPITVGFFATLGISTALVVSAVAALVIAIVATVVIVKKRRHYKKLAAEEAASKENMLGLHEELLETQDALASL